MKVTRIHASTLKACVLGLALTLGTLACATEDFDQIPIDAFPELISPDYNDRLPGSDVTFTWTTVPGATSYELYRGLILPTEDNLTPLPPREDFELVERFDQPGDQLDTSQDGFLTIAYTEQTRSPERHCWFVNARNSFQLAPSNISCYTYNFDPPTLITPQADEVVCPQGLEYSWDNFEGVGSFRLVVTDSSEADVIDETLGSDQKSFVAPTDLTPGDYTWFVESFLPEGGPPLRSVTQSFTVSQPPAPNVNVQGNPAFYCESSGFTINWTYDGWEFSTNPIITYELEFIDDETGLNVFPDNPTSAIPSFDVNLPDKDVRPYSYSMRIRAVDSDCLGLWTETIELSIESPTVPENLQQDPSYCSDRPVRLQWDDAGGGSYIVEISEAGAGTWSSADVDVFTPIAEWTPTVSGSYEWRVQHVIGRTDGEICRSEFSSGSFDVVDPARPDPLPTTDPDFTSDESQYVLYTNPMPSVTSVTPVLRWPPTNPEYNYDVEVFTGSCGGTLIDSVYDYAGGTSPVQWTMNNALTTATAEKYYYRVRSVGVLGCPDPVWSDCQEFSVVNCDSTVAVAPTNLRDNSAICARDVFKMNWDYSIAAEDYTIEMDTDGSPAENWVTLSSAALQSIGSGYATYEIPASFDPGTNYQWRVTMNTCTAQPTLSSSATSVARTFEVKGAAPPPLDNMYWYRRGTDSRGCTSATTGTGVISACSSDQDAPAGLDFTLSGDVSACGIGSTIPTGDVLMINDGSLEFDFWDFNGDVIYTRDDGFACMFDAMFNSSLQGLAWTTQGQAGNTVIWNTPPDDCALVGSSETIAPSGTAVIDANVIGPGGYIRDDWRIVFLPNILDGRHSVGNNWVAFGAYRITAISGPQQGKQFDWFHLGPTSAAGVPTPMSQSRFVELVNCINTAYQDEVSCESDCGTTSTLCPLEPPSLIFSSNGLCSDTGHTIEWTDPACFHDNVTYEIEWSTFANFSANVNSGTPTGSTYSISGLTPGVAYYVRMRTLSPECEDPSPWSEEQVIIAHPKPEAPFQALQSPLRQLAPASQRTRSFTLPFNRIICDIDIEIDLEVVSGIQNDAILQLEAPNGRPRTTILSDVGNQAGPGRWQNVLLDSDATTPLPVALSANSVTVSSPPDYQAEGLDVFRGLESGSTPWTVIIRDDAAVVPDEMVLRSLIIHIE